jgi:hypothetical protein
MVVPNVGHTVIVRHQPIFFLFLLHFRAPFFVIFLLLFAADIVLWRPKPGRRAVPLELVPRKVPDSQLAQLALQVALHQGAKQFSPVRAVPVFTVQGELLP